MTGVLLCRQKAFFFSKTPVLSVGSRCRTQTDILLRRLGDKNQRLGRSSFPEEFGVFHPVQKHRDENDQTQHHLLRIAADAKEVHAVLNGRDNKGTNQRAEYFALATL